MTDREIEKVMGEYAEVMGKAVREKYSQEEENFDRKSLLRRINQARKRKSVFGRLAVCAAAVMLVFVCGLAVHFLPVHDMETELVKSSTDYDYSNFPIDRHIYLPKLLPENIKAVQYTFANSIFTIRYGVRDTSLMFSQGDIDIIEDVDIMERVSVSGSTGYLFEAEGGYNQLIWQRETTTFVLVGNLKADKLVSIAESVR